MVWITESGGSTRKRYHTDKTCQFVRQHRMKEEPKEQAESRGLTECKACKKEGWDYEQSKKYYEAALEADPEDL